MLLAVTLVVCAVVKVLKKFKGKERGNLHI